MSHEKTTIKSFTDLDVWREAHKLVINIYGITKSFPKDEQFGLTNQIRRAAVSVTSNIAEGFSRRTGADRLHFYTMSQGSLTELQNQLLIARDILYISPEIFTQQANQSVVVHKLLTGLIRTTKERSNS